MFFCSRTEQEGRRRTGLPVIVFLLTILSVLPFFIPTAQAAEITLAWNRNSESDIAGYIVYYGYRSRYYTESIDVGNCPPLRFRASSTARPIIFASPLTTLKETRATFRARSVTPSPRVLQPGIQEVPARRQRAAGEGVSSPRPLTGASWNLRFFFSGNSGTNNYLQIPRGESL